MIADEPADACFGARSEAPGLAAPLAAEANLADPALPAAAAGNVRVEELTSADIQVMLAGHAAPRRAGRSRPAPAEPAPLWPASGAYADEAADEAADSAPPTPTDRRPAVADRLRGLEELLADVDETTYQTRHELAALAAAQRARRGESPGRQGSMVAQVAALAAELGELRYEVAALRDQLAPLARIGALLARGAASPRAATPPRRAGRAAADWYTGPGGPGSPESWIYEAALAADPFGSSPPPRAAPGAARRAPDA